MKTVSFDKVKKRKDTFISQGFSQHEKSNLEEAVEKIITGDVFLAHIGEREVTECDDHCEAESISSILTRIFVIEKLELNDPRLNSMKFIKVKRDEIERLIKSGTLEAVSAYAVPN